MSEFDDLIDLRDFDSEHYDSQDENNLNLRHVETWGIKRLKKVRRYYGLLLLKNPENKDAQKKERVLTKYIFKARTKLRYIEGEE